MFQGFKPQKSYDNSKKKKLAGIHGERPFFNLFFSLNVHFYLIQV